VPWEITATYTAIGPTNATSNHWFGAPQTGGRLVPDSFPGAINFVLQGESAAGINFDFSASDPNNAGGHVAGTQLVWSSRKLFRHFGSTLDSITIGTQGNWHLDACTLYDVASGSSNGFHWQGDDSPFQGLAPGLDSVFILDVFKMYFMYRPRGKTGSDSTSIWVPLGKLTWYWTATLRNAGYPDSNAWNLLAFNRDAAQITAGGKDFPEWSNVHFPNDSCPAIPAP
jgi:hypothetical protein